MLTLTRKHNIILCVCKQLHHCQRKEYANNESVVENQLFGNKVKGENKTKKC